MNLNTFTNIPGNGYTGDFSQSLIMTEECGKAECQVVNIYPELEYEQFEGFGGAVTEAAGYIYSQMNEKQRRELIHHYFSPEEMNYRLVRVHLDSCDFCLGQYEAMSDPSDTDLSSFSFARTEQYIIPMLKAAREERKGDLHLMLSPWSPPRFMKSNGLREAGGRLKPEYRAFWAKYLCRYIQEFIKRGFHVQRISIQNEANAVQTWDSCLYTAEEEKVFLRDYLCPEMAAQKLDDIEVFIWDHNKERLFERVRDTVDPSTSALVAGAAFHWYSGDHFEQMDLVKKLYPKMKLIMSESCLEYRFFNESNIEPSIRKLCHEIISDLRHGMQAMYDWNLVLDERGGPNYVGNYAHAAYLYDTGSQTLLPQKTLQYYYQLSHYIEPGSTRLQTTCFSDLLESVAYRTPGGRLVLVLFNRSENPMPVTVRIREKGASLLLPGSNMTSCIIDL